MPPVLKFTFSLLAWIAAGCGLSLLAVHGFWIGVWLFQSVPLARACDAIGQIVLLPVRGAFLCAGSLIDQSAPLSEPFWYAITNGSLLGLIGFFFGTRLKRK